MTIQNGIDRADSIAQPFSSYTDSNGSGAEVMRITDLFACILNYLWEGKMGDVLPLRAVCTECKDHFELSHVWSIVFQKKTLLPDFFALSTRFSFVDAFSFLRANYKKTPDLLQVSTASGKPLPVREVLFAENDNALVVCADGMEQVIQIWDPNDLDRSLATLTWGAFFYRVKVMEDGQILIQGNVPLEKNYRISRWNWKHPAKPLESWVIGSEETFLVSGYSATGEPQREGGEVVGQLEDGFIVAKSRRKVFLWDPDQPEMPVGIFEEFGENKEDLGKEIREVKILEGGKILVWTGSSSLSILDLRQTGAAPVNVCPFIEKIEKLKIVRNQYILVLGVFLSQRMLVVFNLEGRTVNFFLERDKWDPPTIDVIFLEGKQAFVTCSKTGQICIWDLHGTRASPRLLKSPSCTFGHSGMGVWKERYPFTWAGNYVFVWDLEAPESEPQAIYVGHYVRKVEILENGYILTHSEDHMLRIWDLDQPESPLVERAMRVSQDGSSSILGEHVVVLPNGDLFCAARGENELLTHRLERCSSDGKIAEEVTEDISQHTTNLGTI